MIRQEEPNISGNPEKQLRQMDKELLDSGAWLEMEGQ